MNVNCLLIFKKQKQKEDFIDKVLNYKLWYGFHGDNLYRNKPCLIQKVFFSEYRIHTPMGLRFSYSFSFMNSAGIKSFRFQIRYLLSTDFELYSGR